MRKPVINNIKTVIAISIALCLPSSERCIARFKVTDQLTHRVKSKAINILMTTVSAN
jgi:hypothetical protein